MKYWWTAEKVVPPARQRLQLLNEEDGKVVQTTREFIPSHSYEKGIAQLVFDLMERVEFLEREMEKDK